jgi:hypothetical protein
MLGNCFADRGRFAVGDMNGFHAATTLTHTENQLLRQHADVSLGSNHWNQCIPVSHFNRSVRARFASKKIAPGL